MRIKLKDRTLQNDIKYRGILSYRHLRIVAWICLVIAQISNVITLTGKIDDNFQASSQIIQGVFDFIGLLPMPLFLVAHLGDILWAKNQESWKNIFIHYLKQAIGLYILANFIIFHFGFRLIHTVHVNATWWEVSTIFGRMLHNLGTTAYTFNVFIDMLLWVASLFFLNYEPKKTFIGKKLILFRLMIIFPILYEVGGIIIKYAMCAEWCPIPSFVFFALPSKAPLTFVAVTTIIFIFKIMEVRYKKRNNDYFGEKYLEYIQTNAHSLKASIIIATVFAIAITVDVVILVHVFAHSFLDAIAIGKNDQEISTIATKKIDSWIGAGFGGSTSLIFIIPFILLFSYTKKHQNTKIDTYIPIIGIVLIAIVYLEGLFEIAVLDINLILEKLKALFNSPTGG